ncbi:hypothetical protein BUALT_Bualt17G0089500 [Buddleja alternifolia]|uniref:non-specific serine/threonine protein kinase n=1 Tax=Buddleja alternifolia TaxID=168488 RepID=A0AAV6WCN0_9LAMI|nr:hypothetical protein BUALT_Bualt17G0089500 [Buddleja alternifolia]
MSSTSPSPNSPVATSPPPQPSSPPPNPANSPPPDPPSSPPPQPNSPPPIPPSAPPPQPNSPPPVTPSAPPPQPNSPPPVTPSAPPPQPNLPPPTTTTPPPRSPPPTALPPPTSSPPPQPSSPPPPPPNPPAPSPPPPPPSDPPSSPAPPSTNPPPPPIAPENPPPPPPRLPNNPPPPVPQSSPPPPRPPNNSPPPPSPSPRPPPPSIRPPSNSPPPPFAPPPNSTTPSVPSRSPPPSSNSPPISSSPPPLNVSPPPLSPPSPPLAPPGTNPNSNAPETSQSRSSGGLGTGPTVAIVLVLSLLLLGVFGTLACCVWKRKKKASGHNGGHIMPTFVSSPKSDSGLLKVQISKPDNGSGLGNSRSWFAYEELVNATNGFSAHNLLGEGGFGSVYKGVLENGKDVAVKKLKIGGGQGEREFRAEVEIISRIHHRHLVSLVGYCISEERRLLVYDYVPNNTLYFHLHDEGRPVMDWDTRVKIAIGAARGIAYLHEDCHPRIIHRDIKSSNILLDNNFEARVSDFGLAKLAMDANTHITTRVMGTFGYMAPEYASSGKLTEKSDVFSFGVVLLELITGRKPVDTSQPLGDEGLVEWARPLLSHAIETEQFEGIADPRLEKNYIDGEMFRMIEAAAACVRHSSTKRPKMGQVVRAFDNMVTSDLTNGMKVGESEIFNSAQQSAEIRLFQRMAFGSQDYSTDYFTQSSWSSENSQVNKRRNLTYSSSKRDVSKQDEEVLL